jgi:tetratricopeptide (TPR) repeat protein
VEILKRFMKHFALHLACCLMLLCWLAPGCGGKAKLVDMRQDAISKNEDGYKYYRESKWRQAQAKFDEALKLNRLIDHREGIAANLNNLGAVSQEQGELCEAEKHYRDALLMAEQAGKGRGIGEALNNLGVVYMKEGRWSEAARLFQQALGYARSLPPRCPLLPLTLTHLGDVARHNKDYPLALDLYRQALDLDVKARNNEGKAVRWGRLGRTYLQMGDYASARQYLVKALDEFRCQQRTNGIVNTLDALVTLSLAQGDRTQAQLYAERLVKIYEARKQTREAAQLEALMQAPPVR